MAWVVVPGSNGVWEYDNAPTLETLAPGAKVHPDDQYYREANGTVTAGIRSFTPSGGNTQETYVKCRKVGNDYPTRTVGPWGELNKNYYDERI
jgi:phage-related tail fiber protein